MLKREITADINKYLESDDYKTFYIWGPRRSGKTTILKQLSKELNVPVFNFDYESDRAKFVPDKNVLEKLVKDFKVILIDEVQNYPESTVVLKLLHDEFKIKVIATGSSELKQKGNDFDTQAGRYTEHYCLPLSISEIKSNTKLLTSEEIEFEKELSEKIQIFGSYPEIYVSDTSSDAEKIENLNTILDAYILKDIVNIYELKNLKLAKEILTKIALQLGSEVSIREIAQSTGSNAVTVSNYIEIFVKNYILIPLPSFKTNIRKAVSDNRKLYFYDLGIRNALVKDFRETKLRPDSGGLFENFIVLEIEKLRRNKKILASFYFYREYGGKEVDLIIEDYKKNYKAIEIKSKSGSIKDIFPLKHKSEIINSKNYFGKLESVLNSFR